MVNETDLIKGATGLMSLGGITYLFKRIVGKNDETHAEHASRITQLEKETATKVDIEAAKSEAAIDTKELHKRITDTEVGLRREIQSLHDQTFTGFREVQKTQEKVLIEIGRINK